MAWTYAKVHSPYRNTYACNACQQEGRHGLQVAPVQRRRRHITVPTVQGCSRKRRAYTGSPLRGIPTYVYDMRVDGVCAQQNRDEMAEKKPADWLKEMLIEMEAMESRGRCTHFCHKTLT